MTDSPTLCHLFEKAAKSFPKQISVEETKTSARRVKNITYQELNESSIELASILQGFCGEGNCTTVLCVLRPSIVLVVAVLSILKASCAFAFLDLRQSAECLQSFQQKLGAKILLGEKDLLQHLMKKCGEQWTVLKEMVVLDVPLALVSLASSRDNASARNMTDTAYVALTSGSTGLAKVIRVPHTSIVPNILHLREIFEVTEEDVVPLMSPMTFDPSVVDIFLALSSGAKLLVIPEAVKAAPRNLSHCLHTHGVTLMQMTPSVLLRFGRQLLRESLLSAQSGLRVVALGGEACPPVSLLSTLREDGNQTAFYNLYGTTEVSCWASFHKLDFTSRDRRGVPLGLPLAETLLEIRNGTNHDEGEIFIGSSTRVCTIDNEPDQRSGCKDKVVWRSTGDWALLSGSQLYFKHRVDKVVKHNGQKVDLQGIWESLSTLQEVEACSLRYRARDRVLEVFIVPRHKAVALQAKGAVLGAARRASWKIPLRVSVVPQLFVTKHGKTDFAKLQSYAQTHPVDHTTLSDPEDVSGLVRRLWKIYTSNESCKSSNNFLESGGDSVSAVQMTLDLEWQLKQTFPLLTDQLLHRTFAHVCTYCSATVQGVEYDSHNEEEERSPSQPARKRTKVDGGQFFSSPVVTECFVSVSRAGSTVHCSCTSCVFPLCVDEMSGTNELKNFSFNEQFKVDLSKCIDASPLIVDYSKGSRFVCIGSHSGQFATVDLRTGQPFWVAQLPDRIESSACVSPCGQRLFVGCYDHCLYCFSVERGSEIWKFQSQGEIKSSPVCCKKHNLVFVGSHDKHLYALHIVSGNCVWKLQVGEGSAFSSPALSTDSQCVFSASLDGTVLAAATETGRILWSASVEKPVFASPLVLPDGGVCFASVSGALFHFNTQGKQVWRFETEGAIFSSPVLLGESIVLGNHSCALYCISPNTQLLIWKRTFASPIYATPFAVPDSHSVLVASTEGRLSVISGCTGEELSSLQYPGQTFSSPVWYAGQLTIGCRDNNLYCHALTAS